jgi:ABC-type transport system involved in multi-copper enzyme maturation permease subunit
MPRGDPGERLLAPLGGDFALPIRQCFGPVFGYEWLAASRRWQVYAGRAFFVFVLLVGLWSVWTKRASDDSLPPIQVLASVGGGFFRAIVFTQMTLVLMVAPAATAGAICQDRSSGKLAQLLVTDLSDSEIILGKLAARLLPVLGLVCCALPVLALSSLLGGVDPLALSGVFLVTVCCAIFGCALALTFSIWASKPYEVLLATYGVIAIWMLFVPVWDFLGWCWGYPSSPDWAIPLNPYYLACAPYLQPDRVSALSFLAFLASILLLTAGLVALAIARLRSQFASQEDPAVRRSSPRRRWSIAGGTDAIDANPVLWYEARRRQLSPWIRFLVRAYFVLAAVFSMLAVHGTIWPSSLLSYMLAAYVVAFQFAIGLPLVLISAATAIVEERARGSLDVLMTTPLSATQIVLAKWWGSFQNGPKLLLLPALIAIVTAWTHNTWPVAAYLGLYALSTLLVWTSIGLAISTWVSRLGRAIAVAVAAYALVGLAWPVLALTIYPGDGLALSAVSPFYGCFDLASGLSAQYFTNAWYAFLYRWISVQAVLAAGLLLVTLATFDRALGRIPE